MNIQEAVAIYRQWRMTENYVGFKAMVASGKSPALAAWIGRKKYGSKKFQNAAASSKTLRKDPKNRKNEDRDAAVKAWAKRGHGDGAGVDHEAMAREKNMHVIRVDKRNTIWSYFATNPQGGGSGSSHSGTKAVALKKAISVVKPGHPYMLVTNGKLTGPHTA